MFAVEVEFSLLIAHDRAIPNELFKIQLLLHIDPGRRFITKHCQVFRRTEGASHHVVMVRLGAKRLGIEYTFKILVTGTQERWNEELAYTMRCEQY
jgi:hypothetical protein